MYDPSKTFEKAAWDLAHSLVGVAAAAAVAYLAQPDALTVLLAAVPAQYALPAGLLASALTAALRNWLKNRDKT